MLLSVEITIDYAISEIRKAYEQTYGLLEPEKPNIACWTVRMALERLSLSDALYHNVEHTIMVILVGLDILRGRHLEKGGVTPNDWLQFVVALACHDIGYVRGVCLGDRPGCYMTGREEEVVKFADTITDASLTPYHVNRGKLFVRQRFEGRPHLDVERICENIEHTRFPVPQDGDLVETDDYPGLLRSADLIGQLADPRYLQKQPGLFYEFVETGTAQLLGYKNPGDLRRCYPAFFWNKVRPYIQDAMAYLRLTAPGNQWISNLQSKVFDVEIEIGKRV